MTWERHHPRRLANVDVVRDDDDQTSRLGYWDTDEAGPHCGEPRDDDSGELVGAVKGLPQSRSSGVGCWRGGRCSGDRGEGGRDMAVLCEPPTAPTASDTRLEGRPGNSPCCDDTGERVGSHDNLPQAPSGGNGYWRGRGCGGGGSPGDQGENVPPDPPTAAHAGDTREANQLGDGPYCDVSERLTGSNDGLPQTRSSGDGWWRGQGCSGGKSAGELGTEVPRDPPTAANASGSREAGQRCDGPYCDDSGRLATSNDGLP